MKEYDIIIRATIEIAGKFTGESVEEALEAAKLELRPRGVIHDIDVERAFYLDPEPEGIWGQSLSTMDPGLWPAGYVPPDEDEA